MTIATSAGLRAHRGVLIVAVLVAALVALPACSGSDSSSGDTTPTTAAGDSSGTEVAATSTAATGSSGSSNVDGLTGAVENVVRETRPSVVQITNQQALSQPGLGGSSGDLVPAGVGSGVIIDDQGHILTNNHVIEGAAGVVVRLTDGREFDAQVVGTDPRTDLAVVQIQGDNLPVAKLGASGDLQVGEWVVAIGNALGLVGGPTVTVGVVSAVGRTVQEPPSGNRQGTFLFDVIQTDAAINPGNSGGPLINLDGEVVGINTLGAGSAGQVPVQGISFAIAIDTALPLAQEMIQTGTVTHPYVGISYVPLNPAVASQLGAPVSKGVAIGQVEPGSPAEAAGMQAGDIITAIDGSAIEGESDLPAALDAHNVGDEVAFTVLRDGSEIAITVVLGEAPTATPTATSSP